MCAGRRSEFPLPTTQSNAHTSCTEIPNVAAITSGTVTSFDTKTQSDDASTHVASEKVAFLTIESTARSYTVALKSSHVIPAMPSDTATIGVRVGLGDGTGVGSAVVGTGVGRDDGTGVGTGVGMNDGKGVGMDDGTGDGADVGGMLGDAVGSGDGSGKGGSVGSGLGGAVGVDVGAEVGADVGGSDGMGIGTGVGDKTQTLRTHANDEQSSPSMQVRPTLQRGHSPPPQSTFVSEASMMPLLHDIDVGRGVGERVGTVVGVGTGTVVGAGTGTVVGAGSGTTVGTGRGTAEGTGSGTVDGVESGTSVGAGNGIAVGVAVGAIEGG